MDFEKILGDLTKEFGRTCRRENSYAEEYLTMKKQKSFSRRPDVSTTLPIHLSNGVLSWDTASGCPCLHAGRGLVKEEIVEGETVLL